MLLKTETKTKITNNKEIKYKFCRSEKYMKHRKTKTNKERFICKDCKTEFSLNDSRRKASNRKNIYGFNTLR